jgi:hypothetical protein
LSPSGYQSEEIISVGTGLYDEYGNETVSEALGTAGIAVDLVNLFAAGGLSRYVRDAGGRRRQGPVGRVRRGPAQELTTS